MAPHIPALAQSESKTRFFQRLGMRTDDVRDKRIYTSMKVCADSELRFEDITFD